MRTEAETDSKGFSYLFTAFSSLIILFLIAVSALAASATVRTAPSRSCVIEDKYAPGLSLDASIDVQAIPSYQATARQMLRERNFRQLDCLADDVRLKKARLAGGMWKLHLIYNGLGSPVSYPMHATQKDWDAHLQQLRQWVALRPTSVTARVALASSLVNYAWDARGGGLSDTVSDSGWKLFNERLTEAKQILDRGALPGKCPEAYVVMQRVALGQSGGADRLRALFDQAVKTEPEYYYYYRVYSGSILPQWGGEEGAVAKFAQESADSIGGERGDALYFQIAVNLLCGCNNDQGLRFSVPRMEKGLAALEKQYGVSMMNLNLMAHAVIYGPDADPVFADSAFKRIGDQWDPETWSQQEHYESARKWASEYAPSVLKRRAMEDAAETNAHSSAGLRYKDSFDEILKGLAEKCVSAPSGSVDKFRVFVRIGAKGNVEDMRIYSNNPIAICLSQTLLEAERKETTPFPQPPQAPYWMRLDVDVATLAPVASNPSH
jgi:hypothetical protein